MKIEVIVSEPYKPPKDDKEAKTSKFTARARFVATIKVEGKSFGDEYVGETADAALKSMCSELLRRDTIEKMVAMAKK